MNPPRWLSPGLIGTACHASGTLALIGPAVTTAYGEGEPSSTKKAGAGWDAPGDEEAR
jgi:hypothetical protein